MDDEKIKEDEEFEKFESIKQPEPDYNLQLYKAKDGYRWRFYVNRNIKCIGTDPCKTRDLALDDAKAILENIWILES
jgi:hypothetical protein